MNRLITICITLVVTVGCASTNPVFNKYVNEFNAEATSRNIEPAPFVVYFGKPEPSELSANNLGECRFHPGGRNHVVIDEMQWNDLSEECREVLMYHELGHCGMFKQHAENTIMQADLLQCGYYSENKADLLNELFKHAE